MHHVNSDRGIGTRTLSQACGARFSNLILWVLIRGLQAHTSRSDCESDVVPDVEGACKALDSSLPLMKPRMMAIQHPYLRPPKNQNPAVTR